MDFQIDRVENGRGCILRTSCGADKIRIERAGYFWRAPDAPERVRFDTFADAIKTAKKALESQRAELIAGGIEALAWLESQSEIVKSAGFDG